MNGFYYNIMLRLILCYQNLFDGDLVKHFKDFIFLRIPDFEADNNKVMMDYRYFTFA